MGGAGCKDAGRPVAGNGDRTAGPLAAAHRENDRAGGDLQVSVGRIDGGYDPVRRDRQHHRVRFEDDRGGRKFGKSAIRVLGSGKFLFIDLKAEAVVDTLIEYSARLVVPLQDEDVSDALATGLGGGCKLRPAPMITKSARIGSLLSGGRGGFPNRFNEGCRVLRRSGENI